MFPPRGSNEGGYQILVLLGWGGGGRWGGGWEGEGWGELFTDDAADKEKSD